MEPNHKFENDEGLSQVLRQWTVDTPLPPRFHEEVWQRIARAETRPESTFWAGLSRLVEVLLPRPRVAFSYVALLLALGIAAGSLAAQSRTRRLDADLSLRYVQSVDPYRSDTLHP